MTWESTLTPTSACGLTFSRLSLVAFPFCVNCAVSDISSNVCIPESGCRPTSIVQVQTSIHRPWQTSWLHMPLSGPTRATRQHGAARQKWDWPRSLDVYLSTTISGNQFATSPSSSEAETVYRFLCLPVGSPTVRSQNSAVLCSLIVADLCPCVFPTKCD